MPHASFLDVVPNTKSADPIVAINEGGLKPVNPPSPLPKKGSSTLMEAMAVSKRWLTFENIKTNLFYFLDRDQDQVRQNGRIVHKRHGGRRA